METVPTKVYEALQDFVLPKVTPEGAPDGEASYTKGEKYEMPEAVAALAPEGALKEFVVETPPAATPAASAPATPEKPAPVPAKAWVGNHKV